MDQLMVVVHYQISIMVFTCWPIFTNSGHLQSFFIITLAEVILGFSSLIRSRVCYHGHQKLNKRSSCTWGCLNKFIKSQISLMICFIKGFYLKTLFWGENRVFLFSCTNHLLSFLFHFSCRSHFRVSSLIRSRVCHHGLQKLNKRLAGTWGCLISS